MTIHRQPVRPCGCVDVIINEHITVSEDLSVVIIRADGTVERRESKPKPSHTPVRTEVITEWRWYFDELPEGDVVTVCEEHIAKLEALVAECESLFVPCSASTGNIEA